MILGPINNEHFFTVLELEKSRNKKVAAEMAPSEDPFLIESLYEM